MMHKHDILNYLSLLDYRASRSISDTNYKQLIRINSNLQTFWLQRKTEDSVDKTSSRYARLSRNVTKTNTALFQNYGTLSFI